MRVLIDIGHPAHVHLFKNLALSLQEKGHQVYFSVKDIYAARVLLDKLGFDYFILGKKYNGLFVKYLMTFIHLIRLWRFVVLNKIDIGIGISGLVAHVSMFSKMKSICLDDDDSEATPIFARSIRKADVILTPAPLLHDLRGKNHITYRGYHELAYLHPNQFRPDPTVLREMGLNERDSFYILRFNAFRAHHDVGEHGLDVKQKLELIGLLKSTGRVFISSENNADEFDNYKLSISEEKIHSMLYYASIFIGDSQTMTSEAALLGVPALKCNSFARRLSIPNEIEKNYGLCHSYQPDEFEQLKEKVIELLDKSDTENEYRSRRQKMLSEKIDVTAFMVWFIENYPESKKIMLKNPNYQDRFR